jgi:hypothetical protein
MVNLGSISDFSGSLTCEYDTGRRHGTGSPPPVSQVPEFDKFGIIRFLDFIDEIAASQ